MTDIDLQILGFLVVGVPFLLWFSKRRFDRTDSSGTEHFSSYGHRIRARLFDSVLLGVGGGFLSLSGLWFIIEYAPGLAMLTVVIVLGLLIENDRSK